MTPALDYSPQNEPPSLKRFCHSDALFRIIIGPLGSGKTTRCVKEIARRALRQKPGPDGIRHTRFAVIRNTYGQLRDTTRKTFEEWIPAWMGEWNEQAFTFRMRFDDVDSEILFRALDRPEDVRKLLSLELTGAYINEAREVPKHVLDVLEGRIGRFPARAQGGPTWAGIWADTNPWHGGHWGAKLAAKHLPGYEFFRQPGGRAPNAENIDNLPPGYYERLCVGKDSEYVRVYVDGEDGDSDTGSVWGAWIAALQKRKGICAFDHDADRVITSWDLGRSDATAIWFWRIGASGNVEVLDHYENAGQGLSHFFQVVDSKPYTYQMHLLPHDAKAKTLATQRSVLEQCAEHWGAAKVGLTPELSLADGISAARWLLEQPILFHERCDVPSRLEHSGVEALREYRYEWDEEAQCYSRVPLHNWASHTADAFRYLACAVKAAKTSARKHDVPGRHTRSVPRPASLDDVWRDADRAARDY